MGVPALGVYKYSLFPHHRTLPPGRGLLPFLPFISFWFRLSPSSCFLAGLFTPTNGQSVRPSAPGRDWGVTTAPPLFLPLAQGLRVPQSRRASLRPAYPALAHQDVNLKMPRNNQLLHFAFREDKQWKLQQIQDARNHVSQAIYLLANRDENYQFRTGAEVLKLMDAVMLQLTRARNRLTTPATLTLPEIAASGLTVSA